MSRMDDPVVHDSPSSDASIVSPVKKRFPDVGFFGSIIIAVVLAIGIRYFVAAPYIVSGSSMEPNFQDYNYLLVDRLSYRFSEPQRGDVIVLDLPEDTSRALIKRVIGVPGDTVILSGDAPTVTIINAEHPKGLTLEEPYVAPEDDGGTTNTSYTLGENQYFVLGDNRKVSADSRYWGLLDKKYIVGRVLIRLFPFDEIGFFPSEARYTSATTDASSSPAR